MALCEGEIRRGSTFNRLPMQGSLVIGKVDDANPSRIFIWICGVDEQQAECSDEIILTIHWYRQTATKRLHERLNVLGKYAFDELDGDVILHRSTSGDSVSDDCGRRRQSEC
jgi:exosome complex RNA-binding protein Csl4